MAQKISRKIGEGKQKKVLSLVLCVAMMLSVMVVGAGAAFSDQSKIKNTEAVDACTALNIIGGYPDGSFKPEGNITRAEVTKMICVALNGGKNPAVSTNTTPTFSDVRNNANAAWAEGYIESCAAQGIVSGVGGGKFAPNGNVTGVQLAKMLLVSLGYKSENEGFTGNAWATNVNMRAAQKGLYKGLETMDTAAAITRDNAAQMVWNALQAYEVEYKTTLVADSKGQLSSQITVQDKVVGSTNDKITLLRDKYDAYVNIGTLVNIDGKDLTIAMSNSDVAESDTKDTAFTKLDTDYSSLLGQKVKVIFKNGKANDVLGVYATGDNTVYKALLNDVEKDGSKIKFGGTSYSVDNNGKIATTKIGIDGTTTSDWTVSQFDTDANKTSLNEVTFIDTDDNDKIDTAIVIEKVAGEVTGVASDKITFNGKTYKYADESIDKNIAADDWAVMSVDLYKDCKTIVKADVVTDKLNGTKDKGIYSQYQIANTWYNIAEDNNSGYDKISIGDTAKAYVANGVILNVDTDDGTGAIPTNIAVVVGKGSGSLYGDQVKVRFFDGTLKTVTIDSDKQKDTITEGYAYKISGSDAAAKLEALSKQKYNGYENQVLTGQTKTVSGQTIDEKRVADNAVIVIYNTTAGTSKTITGKQFNNLSADSRRALGNATSMFTKDSNGLNRVRLAAISTTSSVNDISGISNDNYGYITSDAVKRANGDVTYTLWNGSQNLTVTEENGDTSKRAKGTVIGYSTIDSNNYIQDVDEAYGLLKNVTNKVAKTDALAVGANEGSDTKSVSVNDVQLNVTADTKVLVIDTSADGEAIGQTYTYGTTTFRKANKVNSTYQNNVAYILDEAVKDGKADLELLIIDNTGSFDWLNDSSDPTPSTEKGDYPTKWAEVKVADKNLVTYAASTRNSQTGEVTVDLTLDSTVDTVDPSKITVKKDGVRVSSPTNTTIDDGHYIFTVGGVAANDSKLSIDVAAGFVTATTVTVTDVNGTITAAGLDASTDVTANNAVGLTPTVTWYNKNTKDKVKTDAPANVNVSVTPVGKTTAKATVTLKKGTSAPTAGTYYFTVTVNGVESAVKTLTIS